MKKYNKPFLVNMNSKTGIVPALAIASIGAAAAFAVGVASGLMKDERNINRIALNSLPKCIE